MECQQSECALYHKHLQSTNCGSMVCWPQVSVGYKGQSKSRGAQSDVEFIMNSGNAVLMNHIVMVEDGIVIKNCIITLIPHYV